MKIKKGVKLVEEREGSGEVVVRQQSYVIGIRITLNKGEVVRTPNRCLSSSLDGNLKMHNDGFFEHRVRIDRDQLVPGIFYGIQGMRVGGFRKVIISPHLAYGGKGIPGTIPKNAKLTVEIEVLRGIDKEI